MRDALLLHDTLSITGILITAILLYLVIFLPLFPTCFTFLAWRRPWNVRDLMFSTCKKRRWRFRKRRFGVYVFSVRYSIRFVYQAWLSWIALLSHCKVTADVVGCRGLFR